MKKTIPFILSILAIASIASTAVLGNTQAAYAGGGSCGVTPSNVDVILAPGASSQVIPKSIDCNGGPDNVVIDTDDCSNKGIDVSFENTGIPVFLWKGDETITNDNNAVPGDVICLVSFDVDTSLGPTVISQTITVTTPEPTVVGGEFSPIDSTALLLSSAQSFSWMIPVVLSVLGIGLFVVSRKSE